MKTISISRISGAVLSLFIALNSFAQKGTYESKSFTAGKLEYPGTPKKISQHFLAEPNAKLEKLGDNLLVSFTTDETSTNILFDKTGRMIYAINYCSEKQLPQQIESLVKNKYEDYTITGAAKVFQENRKIWLINLAGKNNYVSVRIEDGEMNEVENFKKAN